MTADNTRTVLYFRCNCYYSRLAKIAEVKSKLAGAGGFRETLKSTGQSKYALEEEEKGVCTV